LSGKNQKKTKKFQKPKRCSISNITHGKIKIKNSERKKTGKVSSKLKISSGFYACSIMYLINENH
jgi:hypothetical protein